MVSGDRGYRPHREAGELYDLASDTMQQENQYAARPEKVKELADLMKRYVAEGRSTPGPPLTNDVEIIWDKRGK